MGLYFSVFLSVALSLRRLKYEGHQNPGLHRNKAIVFTSSFTEKGLGQRLFMQAERIVSWGDLVFVCR